jgi:serine/threonine-protein kinase
MKLELSQDWEVGKQIGGGGFGAVYEARSFDGQQAAVKMVLKEPGADRELLFTELTGVRNVVPVIDSGEHDGHWVLVMPRAEKSLRDHLTQQGRLSLNETVAVIRDIAKTLADLDGQVVHRDLKPENVLLFNDHWCLADFGIARYAEATTAQHTYKGGGTAPYKAPEVWKYERATSATDIYALGIIAYELLEGRPPFTGPEWPDFHDQHLHSTPPPLTTAPAPLAALITECLFKASQSRPAPGNVQERLRRISSLPGAGGLAALAEANRAQAAKKAEAERQASEHATEEDRHDGLFESAKVSFNLISDEILTTITNVLSSADVDRHADGAWSIRLGLAQLSLGPIKQASNPQPFETIAATRISLTCRPKGYSSSYAGRGHSLWYADARTEGQYQWFETAFMHNPLTGGGGSVEPFALEPNRAGAALGPGMTTQQPAWPFTPLTTGDLNDFIERWAAWLATASEGALQRPSRMPEHNPHGSWRQSR